MNPEKLGVAEILAASQEGQVTAGGVFLPQSALATRPEEPRSPEHVVEFFAYETIGTGETDISGLAKKLRDTDDCQQYLGAQGTNFRLPSSWGSTTIPVLEFLWGMPLCNAVLAYVAGLHPTLVRITRGECTTDSCNGRVTILISPQEGIEEPKDGYALHQYRVTRIEQEITVAYSCGADVDAISRAIREGHELPTSLSNGPFINSKALE
jgi:hypothetical protein